MNRTLLLHVSKDLKLVDEKGRNKKQKHAEDNKQTENSAPLTEGCFFCSGLTVRNCLGTGQKPFFLGLKRPPAFDAS